MIRCIHTIVSDGGGSGWIVQASTGAFQHLKLVVVYVERCGMNLTQILKQVFSGGAALIFEVRLPLVCCTRVRATLNMSQNTNRYESLDDHYIRA